MNIAETDIRLPGSDEYHVFPPGRKPLVYIDTGIGELNPVELNRDPKYPVMMRDAFVEALEKLNDYKLVFNPGCIFNRFWKEV